MSDVITLSGWTQSPNAIASLVPCKVQPLDYSEYPSLDAFYDYLASMGQVTHVIAWSMGAQLAVMATLQGIISPKKMTLIAPPFQFVQDDRYDKAMDTLTFSRFRDQYLNDTDRLSSRFHGLIAKNDARMREVLSQLEHHEYMRDTQRWIGWLDALASHSLHGAPLHRMPDTQIIHGERDAIVPLAQSGYFTNAAPHIIRHVMTGAAHAPHLHDTEHFLHLLRKHHGALA